jgi:CHASE2 domain-containing sensor protein
MGAGLSCFLFERSSSLIFTSTWEGLYLHPSLDGVTSSTPSLDDCPELAASSWSALAASFSFYSCWRPAFRLGRLVVIVFSSHLFFRGLQLLRLLTVECREPIHYLLECL